MPKKPIAYRGDKPFVFVSYAHADAELAYPLISGLQERGLRVWFDDGLDVGDLWDEVIPDHVEQCAAMLCLVSSRFTDSNNCLDEIHYAKEQKKELMILHLENEELPRNFRFRYSRFHALRLSDYSDRNGLMDKLAATQKLRCCLGQVQKGQQEPRESPEELYQKGEVCYNAKSYEEAVEWYRKAAEQGHAEALRSLGVCYQEGFGVLQSWDEAARWYRQAADKGDSNAMNNLGWCYQNGYGIPQSWKDAIMWYRQGAEKGDSNAMYNLGWCYENGMGINKSYEEAIKWYRQAVVKGNAAAMNNLGYCYEQGHGVTKSPEEAATWYRQAADKGEPTAMRNLGNCYTYGWGVARDKKQADYWKNKAKEAEASK